ncbi:hypothetical protein N431DRAFT_79558 [Stipitochalara longipes BDJ]|nr:hypothetical protein N431DRAFT_79558 [Stipitochalara longipes BDJ]
MTNHPRFISSRTLYNLWPLELPSPLIWSRIFVTASRLETCLSRLQAKIAIRLGDRDMSISILGSLRMRLAGKCTLTPESLPDLARRGAVVAEGCRSMSSKSQEAAATMRRAPARTHLTPAIRRLLEAFQAFCGDDRQIWQSDGSLPRLSHRAWSMECSAAVGHSQTSIATHKDDRSDAQVLHNLPSSSLLEKAKTTIIMVTVMVEHGESGVDSGLDRQTGSGSGSRSEHT